MERIDRAYVKSVLPVRDPWGHKVEEYYEIYLD